MATPSAYALDLRARCLTPWGPSPALCHRPEVLGLAFLSPRPNGPCPRGFVAGVAKEALRPDLTATCPRLPDH
eukprot:4111924-Pyramimonas_sp.AAC.1